MNLYKDELLNLKKLSEGFDNERYVAKQILDMHNEALSRKKPVIVELGVDIGNSTRSFLNAIDEKEGALLVSVDILDCSHVAASDKWIFVKQDSADINSLIKKVPALKDGIDILYVDSLHEYSHVRNEIYNFFPYMKKGGVIFFDDTDSSPYMIFQRKDNPKVEIANRKIHNLLDQIFLANIGIFDYTIHRGSTGLSRFDVLSPIGTKLNPPLKTFQRNSFFLWLPWIIFSYLKRKILPQAPRKKY